MFDSMFKLLNLTPLTFSTTAASRNYKDIMSVVHPDKNKDRRAEHIAKAVTHAYATLTIPTKRLYYMFNGTPSVSEGYDNGEAAEFAEQLNILLNDHARRKKQHSLEVLEDIGNVPHMQVPQEEEKSQFESFLKERREVADSSSPHPTRDQNSKSPLRQSPEKSSPSPVSLDHPSARNDYDPPSPKPMPNISAGPSLHDSEESEVINLASDSDSEDVHPEEVFHNINPFNSNDDSSTDVESLPSHEDAADDDHGIDRSRSKGEEEVPVSPAGSGMHVDVGTSPYRASFVDRGTSPFKPGDPVVFWTPSTGVATPRSSKDRIRRNLSFRNDAYFGYNSKGSKFQSSNRTQASSSSPNCARDYLSSSLAEDGSIVGDPGQRLYIKTILNMRTRADGVRFRVVWAPGDYECTEKLESVLKEKKGLRNWLYKLRFEEPRRFSAVMKFHPEFKEVLNDAKSSSAGRGASKKNRTFY